MRSRRSASPDSKNHCPSRSLSVAPCGRDLEEFGDRLPINRSSPGNRHDPPPRGSRTGSGRRARQPVEKGLTLSPAHLSPACRRAIQFSSAGCHLTHSSCSSSPFSRSSSSETSHTCSSGGCWTGGSPTGLPSGRRPSCSTPSSSPGSTGAPGTSSPST